MREKFKLNIINNTIFSIEEYEENFYSVFYEVIKCLNIKDNLELSLIFVDKKTQKDLNIKYRNKDYVADVLTFYQEEKDKLNSFSFTGVRELGDIFVCYEIALEQAKRYNHSIKRELSFLFLHGFLHILGYDHIEKKDEKIMFGLQEKVLNNLKIFRK